MKQASFEGIEKALRENSQYRLVATSGADYDAAKILKVDREKKVVAYSFSDGGLGATDRMWALSQQILGRPPAKHKPVMHAEYVPADCGIPESVEKTLRDQGVYLVAETWPGGFCVGYGLVEKSGNPRSIIHHSGDSLANALYLLDNLYLPETFFDDMRRGINLEKALGAADFWHGRTTRQDPSTIFEKPIE